MGSLLSVVLPRMMVVRPCLVTLLGLAVALASHENCCERKTVGDRSYTLEMSGGKVPPECLNSCVYNPDDDHSKRFCFASGYEKSTCHKGIFDPKICPNYNVMCSIENPLSRPTVVTTPDNCGETCQKNSNCKAWTMIPQDPTPPNALCYFLTSCAKKEKYPGRISGDRSCPPNKFDLSSCPVYDVNCIDETNVGNPNNLTIVKTPDECGDLCQKDGNCSFWTMVPEFLPQADCYLLSSCHNATHVDRTVSGSNDCPDEPRPIFDPNRCPNYNVRCSIANPLSAPTVVTTPDECGRKCQSNLTDCRAWTMIPQDPKPPNATCYFLTSCPNPEKYPGRISGDKSCPPNATSLASCPFYDVDCIGANNVGNPSTTVVTTPDQCGDLCQKDGNCKFWTMVPSFLPPADCYLLSSCENATHVDRDVSGSFDCPPLR